MMPFASVLAHSSVHVNTLCERLDSLFMAVSPTFLAAWPRTIRLATSFTAAQEKSLILLIPWLVGQHSPHVEMCPAGKQFVMDNISRNGIPHCLLDASR